MGRGKQFHTACVQEAFPSALHLSIYFGSSAATVPIAMLSNVVDWPITPRHCVMTCSGDGAPMPVGAGNTQRATPSSSPALKTDRYCASAGRRPAHTSSIPADCESSSRAARRSFRVWASAYTLADCNSTVVLRRLEGSTGRQAFLAAVREMVAIMKWIFGELLEVGSKADAPAFNTSLIMETMPFHNADAFKVVDGVPAPSSCSSPSTLARSARAARSSRPCRSLGLPLHTLCRHTWRARKASFGRTDLGHFPLIVS